MRDGVLEMLCADWIVPSILARLREQGCYGHELTRSMMDFGFEATHPVAMYRTLRQLEQEGLVVSEPVGFDGRLSRRSYSLTGLGEAYLEYLANALVRYRKEIDLFLRLYNERPHQGTAIETQQPLG